MKNYITYNKLKNYIFESILFEGKHWPEDYKKTAINTIKNSPLGKTDWYSDKFIIQDVNTFINEFGPLSHKNSNLGYFAVIIKWFVEYVGDNKNKYQEFIERKLDGIIRDLLWLSNSLEELKIKDNLKTKWSFADFEKYQETIEDKRTNTKIDIKTEKHEYDIIPIESYDQLNSMFGGDKTGYQGKSEWCHTNGIGTYKSWTEGKNKFFVLARKDWQKIEPPDPKTTNAYDDYGLSLIAILINISSMKLKNATLRWNHIIEPSKTVPGTSVDHAFNSIKELNQIVGFDIEGEIKSSISNTRKRIRYIKNNATQILLDAFKKYKNISKEIFANNDELLQAKSYVKDLIIPNNIVRIKKDIFLNCKNIQTIQFGKNLKFIEDGAFMNCSNIESLIFPDSLEFIGVEAFSSCRALKTIKFGNNLDQISRLAFASCSNLENIIIPGSTKVIGNFSFSYCRKLESLKLEDGVEYIGGFAFTGCKNLKEIILSDSIHVINTAAFSGIPNLTSILRCSNKIKNMALTGAKW